MIEGFERVRNFNLRDVTFLENIKESLGKCVIEIFGVCSAVFDGRIKSNLNLGDRLLLIKKDQTILLHGLTGLKPLNWQLPGAGNIEFRLISNSDGKNDEENDSPYLELYTFRPKTNESFTIVFEIIYSVWAMYGDEDSNIIIEGNEADMQTYLVKNPDLIDESLLITEREYNTPIGKIDLIGKDKNGNSVLIELKKGNVTPADAFQIVRYRKIIEKIWNNPNNVRALIIGSNISEKVFFYLKENKIEYKEIKWNEIFPSIPRIRKKMLQDFI
jgi:RecB family endonuclease NucS